MSNIVFEFKNMSFLGRIVDALKGDFLILTLIFILANIFLPFERAFIFWGFIFALYILEISLWRRYYLLRIEFTSKTIILKYKYFDREYENEIDYNDLSVSKEQLSYKRGKKYYLNFRIKDKSILKQHPIGKIDNAFMDNFVNIYQSIRSERRISA